MADAILYCDKCGHIIPPSEKSTALIGATVAICASCARGLSEDERARIRGDVRHAARRPTPRPRSESSVRRSARSPRPRASIAPVSGNGLAFGTGARLSPNNNLAAGTGTAGQGNSGGNGYDRVSAKSRLFLIDFSKNSHYKPATVE